MTVDRARGKALFDNRIEYPLPAKAGVRDYVFYVPTDAYGTAARAFFNKHYSHHVAHNIATLEDLISILYADVTQGGVQQIREVVIVSHGSDTGVLLPLLNQPTGNNVAAITASSLACLQQQVLAGKLDAFKAKRAAVISRMTAESWVTLRVCRFGSSLDGMYALYSFFGGSAEVYAPRAYQFFGPQAIGPEAAATIGTRFPSKQAYHQHLVLQHFINQDVHTPDRQELIVDSLADSGSFSTPFSLATRQPNQPAPADYAVLVDTLNKGKISQALQDVFVQHGLSLSPPPTPVVLVRQLNRTWTIKHGLQHPALNQPVEVHYHIGEQPDADGQHLQLWAQAQLVFALDAHDTVPLQLFFEDSIHNLFNGKLFPIALTTEGDGNDAPNKVNYDAFLAILNGNGAQTQNFGDGAGHDLRTVFQSEGTPLSPAATITAMPSEPPRGLEHDVFDWKVWQLDDTSSPLVKTSYKIKLEHPFSPSGPRMHAINVSKNLTGYEREQLHYYVSTRHGTNPDTPGVELRAYLDRLSTDDLVDLATYLRSPYKPEHVFYLSQTVQALQRKGNALEFFKARFPDFGNTPLPSADTLLELSSGERDDLRERSYQLDFTSWWPIKGSARSPAVFSHDLFLEEQLTKRLGMGDQDPCNATLTLVPDSPATDQDQLKQAQTASLAAYFATTAAKITVSAPSGDNTECSDFKAVITTWNTVQSLPLDQLRDSLFGQHTTGGKSYWDVLMDLKGKYGLLRNMAKLTELIELPDFPIPDVTDNYEMAKLVATKTATILKWEVAGELLKVLGDYDFILTVPMEMWMQVATAQVDAAHLDRARGKVAAMRQWLRALIDYTFSHEDAFQQGDVFDDIEIKTQLGSGPYYLDHYYEEARWVDYERGNPILKRIPFSLEALGNGYDEGILAIELHVWPQIQRLVKQVTSDMLHDSHLDSCKLQVLNDAGFLSVSSLEARVVREFARKLLDVMPGV